MAKYHIEVSTRHWTVRYRTENGFPVRVGKKAGISFDIPVSVKPDPDAGPKWVGYVTTENRDNLNPNHPGRPLLGNHLVYQFGMDIQSGSRLNFMSDSNNLNGPNPAAIRPFLKNASWPMMGLPNRWWSKTNWVLKDCPLMALDVSLDPSQWADVYGGQADSSPTNLAAFRAVKAKPSYIGFTFGGGWYAGHGVNVTGKAVFNLFQMWSMD